MDGKTAAGNRVPIDEVGSWTEIKLEIIRKYAATYSRILNSQEYIRHYSYIDAFAGSGYHRSKVTRDLVEGSPRVALSIEPPFSEYVFIDLDRVKVRTLRELEASHRGLVRVHEGDCNSILVDEVLPAVRFDTYRRALCLLDPYGLHLHWDVVRTAGKLGTVEIFLNFPTMDMNRNVLKRARAKVAPEQEARMTAFWGNEGWRDAAYRKELDLFGEVEEKETNEAVVSAYCERLKSVAGFEYVAPPLPMRNSRNAVVYYLVFASPNRTGGRIVTDIFNRYR
jgi:three-Cys-motif partner protein